MDGGAIANPDDMMMMITNTGYDRLKTNHQPLINKRYKLRDIR